MEHSSVPAQAPAGSARAEAIGGISVYNLVSGILVALGSRGFSDQDLLTLLHKMQDEAPVLRRRFAVRGGAGEYRSDPIRETLSFMEMYNILELPPLNTVMQYYRCRPDMLETLRDSLRTKKLLPTHDRLFKELADELAAPAQPR